MQCIFNRIHVSWLATSILVAIFILGSIPLMGYAQSVTAIQGKISSRKDDIQNLEAEIRKYTNQLTTIGQKKQTLTQAVRELNISRKRVSAQMRLSQRRINSTTVTIQTLNSNINSKEKTINHSKQALKETLLKMNSTESVPLVVSVLGSKSLSTLWQDIDMLTQFQATVKKTMITLRLQKKNLEIAKKEKEGARQTLVVQRTESANQKHALDLNRKAKKTLLKETANRESTYQKLVAAKKQERDAFAAQLRAYQDQLKYILNPNSIPQPGKGTLRWPLQNITITQYFGTTAFSKTGAYSGRGHNGVDFRAAPGTPVYATLSGQVWRTNEGIGKNCQYGKWVLLKHTNGLATLYAHLSDIAVTKGEMVATGQTVGYSGSTGYATGPHLHLTVYVADAVSFKSYKCRSGPTVAVPIAAYSAYLNPLDYLK